VFLGIVPDRLRQEPCQESSSVPAKRGGQRLAVNSFTVASALNYSERGTRSNPAAYRGITGSGFLRYCGLRSVLRTHQFALVADRATVRLSHTFSCWELGPWSRPVYRMTPLDSGRDC